MYYLTAAFSFLLLFAACGDDNETVDDYAATSGDFWEEISGLYRGRMVVNIDGVDVDTFPQQVTVTSDNRNRMTMSLNSLFVDGMTWNNVFFKNVYVRSEGSRMLLNAETVQNLGQVDNVSLTMNAVLYGSELDVTMVAKSVMIRPVTMTMKAVWQERALNSEAEIVRMRMNHPLVIGQPVQSGSNQFTFYLPDTLNMDSTEILVCPEFELSEGATISFPDSVMNFAKRVSYTVMAQDSIHRKNFTVQWVKARKQTFGFGRWQNENGWDEPASGWGTNNGALKMLMDEGKYDGDWCVRKVKGLNVGEWAAEMRTVLVGSGEDRYVFAGSVFQGYFDLTAADSLKAPVYGVPAMNGYQPQNVEGYYKYYPSQQIYVADSLVQDTVMRNDTCCIRAILFEIVNPEDRLDSLNYMNDPRLVAVAEMGDQAGVYQPEFKEFSISFKYIRNFFPSKRYKIALICSSSRDAEQRKKGGPGSMLVVGGVEVKYPNAN